MKSIEKVLPLMFIAFAVSCQLATRNQLNTAERDETLSEEKGKEVVLRIEATDDNSRNSEGDFVALNDGRILYVYTHFTAGGYDFDPALLVGRYSNDGGMHGLMRPR